MGRKFFEIDEEFICENCGKKIEPLGYSCRNHCNYCLHSKHVDINPGDRSRNMPWSTRTNKSRARFKKRIYNNI